MGAGKGYAIDFLVKKGRFPLMAFVKVNSDAIRRYLPEYHLYVDTNADMAGDLTNKEAGYIAEILALAGLKSGKNILVDGSLRRASWYRQYFCRLRKEFPGIRLAIIHVTAPRDAIFQRASVSIVHACWFLKGIVNNQSTHMFDKKTHCTATSFGNGANCATRLDCRDH